MGVNGKEIKEVRRALGMSQEQFAREVGATLGSVWRWETGERKPLPVFAEKIQQLRESLVKP